MKQQVTINGAPADIFADLADKAYVLDLLGIKEATLKRWCFEGRIPHFRLGSRKLIRFRKSELAAWLEAKQ